tara:strand:+ start:279 stop:1067 length:789 start_codon:yes stop_codon:yes gene_type:complete
MNIPFYKCNGNGNSFIIILHHNTLKKSIFKPSFIKEICLNEKRLVDGLVLVNIKNNEFIMDYFNNDGSWETLCLNGLRCASLLLYKEVGDSQVNIHCNHNLYKTKILKNDLVSVNLSKPKYKMKNVEVSNFIGEYIDVGAKHFVIHYNENWPTLEKIESIAQSIRYNKSIFPDGINVNFYKILDSKTLEVKTYEKGIESMMDSCASGSYACAFDYFKKNNFIGKIKVQNIGGMFQIIFDENYMNNTLIGKAEIEYKDSIEVN